MAWVSLAIRVALALVFGTAGIAKILDLQASSKAITDFGFPVWLAHPLGIGPPLIEVLTAVLLLLTRSARIGAIGALALLLAFSATIAVNIALGRRPECHCFGQVHSEPTCQPSSCADGYSCTNNSGICTCDNLCGTSCCPSGGTCRGSTCCSSSQTCANGTCVTTCASGETPYGTTCCSSGQTCSNGACVTSCPSGETPCGTTYCSSGQTCSNGSCVANPCDDCVALNGPGCTFCGGCGQSVGCCPPGTYCLDATRGACCPQGATGASVCSSYGESFCCNPGYTCCPNTLVSYASYYCCPPGETCYSGPGGGSVVN